MIIVPARVAGLSCVAAATMALVGLVSSPASAQSLGVCNSFYSPGFAVAEGRVNPTVPNMNKPAKGIPFKEPNFNTCVVRATDRASEGSGSSFLRNDYSRRQAFNADNTYFIVYAIDGWWYLYDARTLRQIRKLSPRVAKPDLPVDVHLASDAEPQWHPTDPNALYYVQTYGGNKLYKLDVRNNTYTVAADFTGKFPHSTRARRFWTKSEGSPSADGRYWGFQVEDANFNMLGYMVWDLEQGRVVGSRADSRRPDHSSMSASGRWFISSDDATGTWAWSPDFRTKKRLLHKSEHSDLALGPNGEDYYVSIDYQSNAGDVFFVNIDTCPAVDASATSAPVCPRTVLFPTYSNGSGTALHVSGKGFNKPGWAVISTYGTSASRNGAWPWYTNKIFAVELKANPRVYPLAYTRVRDGDYWAEPHASVSRDFTRIIYNSNWGSTSGGIDAYIIHVPTSALPGGVVAPPPPSNGPTTGGILPPRRQVVRPAAATVASRQVPPAPQGAPSASGGGSAATGVSITPPGLRLVRAMAAALWQGGHSMREAPAPWWASASLRTSFPGPALTLHVYSNALRQAFQNGLPQRVY